jgi:hypoxanthine phosphoribosyltransferase
MEIIYNKDMIFKKYIDENEIQERLHQMASDINKEYKDKNPLLIGVLNGSFIFLSDLSKLLSIDCEITFVKVSSYHGTESIGKVHTDIELKENVEGRDVIVVEDIVDTGRTVEYLKSVLKDKQPNSIKICSLFFKPRAHLYSHPPDYVGFDISNEFIIGYGLDYNGKYRNLRNIYKLST